MTDKNIDKGSSSFKLWYEKNADDLAARRRQRYYSDPEYRRKVIESNRLYRQKKADADKAALPPAKRQPTRRPISVAVAVGSKSIVHNLFHIGVMAKELGRSSATLRMWESVGILPKTPFIRAGRAKQERLYTAEMICVVKKSVDARGGEVSFSDSSMLSEIAEGWESVGVDIGIVVMVGEKGSDGTQN